MTPEEVKQTFEELKKEGMDDNALLVALGKMYQNGDITKDQLGALIYQLGYQFTEEFDSKPEDEAKEGMFQEEEGDEEEPESEEEEPESEDEPEEESEPEGEEEEEEEESEEDERKKAMTLFGR